MDARFAAVATPVDSIVEIRMLRLPDAPLTALGVTAFVVELSILS